MKSKQVKNEGLKGADVGDGSLTGAELQPNSLGGREVDEASLAGIGPGIMFASFNNIPAALGSGVFTPVGRSVYANGGAGVAPAPFVATDLHARLDDPLTGGSSFLRLILRVDDNDTPLECTISSGEDSCQSGERVSVAEGSTVEFRASFNSPGIDSVAVGWRAITP